MRIIIEIPPEDVVVLMAGIAKAATDSQVELGKAVLDQATKSISASFQVNPWAMFLPGSK